MKFDLRKIQIYTYLCMHGVYISGQSPASKATRKKCALYFGMDGYIKKSYTPMHEVVNQIVL
jgi:hypothetical protein